MVDYSLFANALKDVTAGQLVDMINNNMSLAWYIQKNYGAWISIARMVARSLRKDNPDIQINYMNVARWIQEARLDLWDVIMHHPNGQKWLRSQIVPMEKLLLG